LCPAPLIPSELLSADAGENRNDRSFENKEPTMNRINNRLVTGIAAAFAVTAASIAHAGVSPDFNKSGNVGLDDLQAYMASYFAGDKAADTTGDGTLSVQDLFSFLQEWLAGYIKEPKIEVSKVDGSASTITSKGGDASRIN